MKIHVVIIILTLFCACSPQKVQFTQIEESSTTFFIDVFSDGENTCTHDGVEIRAYCWVPTEVNHLFEEMISSSGHRYFSESSAESTRYIYSQSKTEKKSRVSKQQFLQNGLDFMLGEKQINSTEYKALQEKLGRPEPGQKSYSNQDADLASIMNPLAIGGRHLTTFEISFTNPSDESIKIKNDFVLQRSGNVESALKLEDIVSMASLNGEISANKLLALKSIYFDEEFYLPPNSRAKRLIAFSPITFSDATMKLFTRDEACFKWLVKTSTESIETTTKLFQIDLNSVGPGILPDQPTEFLIMNDKNEILPFSQAHIRKGKLYIDETLLSSNIEILGYTLELQKLYSCRTEFLPTDFVNLKTGKTRTLPCVYKPLDLEP